jgi:hypothetical protein
MLAKVLSNNQMATMMKTALICSFMILFSLSGLSGCVTVKLGSKEGEKADGVSFKEPTSPFEKVSRTEVDKAWQNPKNGNLISYLSDCKDPTDPSLDTVLNNAVTGIADLKILSRETQEIQGREGQRLKASGKVDGVKSEVDLLAFKRNECIYILGHVGVQNSLAVDAEKFERFIQDFRAP